MTWPRQQPTRASLRGPRVGICNHVPFVIQLFPPPYVSLNNSNVLFIVVVFRLNRENKFQASEFKVEVSIVNYCCFFVDVH